jgi:hypothetical protein
MTYAPFDIRLETRLDGLVGQFGRSLSPASVREIPDANDAENDGWSRRSKRGWS